MNILQLITQMKNTIKIISIDDDDDENSNEDSNEDSVCENGIILTHEPGV